MSDIQITTGRSYASSEILRALDAGPAEGEDFYRLKLGGSNWVNVTHEQAIAIALVLDPDSWDKHADKVLGSTIRALVNA